MARSWNKEHATIKKVEGISTAFIIEYFENKVEEFIEQYKNYSTRWVKKTKYRFPSIMNLWIRLV